MCAKFWWGQVGNARKIHWKSWEKLTLSKKDCGMGFRDLRAFNLAMLAKQGWRLLHDTNSLVYKCLKARYFPRTNFLESKVSPNCSYVWKSIMAAMPTLKLGCCWKVGSGYSIWPVLGDKWIPNYPTNSIIHSAKEDVRDALVSDPINQELHFWRTNWIMKMFDKEDAKAMCRIPLSRRYVDDSILWLPNKKGLFIVKSTYKVARELMRRENVVESSDGCAGKRIWASLLNLNIPNKVKVFAWRACNDILPTKMNLVN